MLKHLLLSQTMPVCDGYASVSVWRWWRDANNCLKCSRMPSAESLKFCRNGRRQSDFTTSSVRSLYAAIWGPSYIHRVALVSARSLSLDTHTAFTHTIYIFVPKWGCLRFIHQIVRRSWRMMLPNTAEVRRVRLRKILCCSMLCPILSRHSDSARRWCA